MLKQVRWSSMFERVRLAWHGSTMPLCSQFSQSRAQPAINNHAQSRMTIGPMPVSGRRSMSDIDSWSHRSPPLLSTVPTKVFA
jgi:hypothetical protein